VADRCAEIGELPVCTECVSDVRKEALITIVMAAVIADTVAKQTG
jgi:hypothetical protein